MPQNESNKQAGGEARGAVAYGGKAFNFLLPSADDHISKAILSGSFYEPELLDFLGNFLGQGDLVLDVGANIGNHTVFFAGVCGCDVEAFEPNPDAVRYLKENIQLNSLGSQVSVHEVALSDRLGKVSIKASVPGNLGATAFKADESGSVDAVMADSFSFRKKISLIKIDAEGMDALVLAGARRLVKADRPLIVVEAGDVQAFGRIFDELKSEDYVAVGCFNATDTYVLAPGRTAAERALITKLEASGLVSVQHGLKALKCIVTANKVSLDKVAHLQRQLSAAIFGAAAPAEGVGSIQNRVDVLTEEASSFNEQLAKLREKLERQQSDILEWLKEFSSFSYTAGDITGRLSGFSGDLSRVGDAVATASERSSLAEVLGREAVQASKDVAGKVDVLAERLAQLSGIDGRLAGLSGDMSRIGDTAVAANERALAAESVGKDAAQAGSMISGKLDVLAKQIEGFSKVEIQGLQATKLAEDAHQSIGGLASRVDGVDDAIGELKAAMRSQAASHQSVDERLSVFSGESRAIRSALDSVISRVETIQTTNMEVEAKRVLKEEQVSDLLTDLEQGRALHALEIKQMRRSINELNSTFERAVKELGSKLDKLAAGQRTVASDLEGVRTGLVQSNKDFSRRTLQLKDSLEKAQREGLEEAASKHVALSKRLEQTNSETQLVTERLEALLNGRILSGLTALKRVGTVFRRPVQDGPADVAKIAAAGSGQTAVKAPPEGAIKSAADAPKTPAAATGRAQALKTGVAQVSMPAPTNIQKGAAPAAAAKQSVAKLPAPNAQGVAAPKTSPIANGGTSGAKSGFKAQIDSVRTKLPPYLSRKVTEDDLAFIQRPLRPNGLISVIMTTFNTAEYVEAAVKSILAQSHKNLELIVVDDGSSDGTREKVEEIAKLDPRVRCISFGVNRGTYWCKNYGITRSKGVAVTFMDSDDVSEPTRLEKQYALLSTAGCAVSTCLHERRDLQGNLITVAGRTKRLAYISQMMRKGVFGVLGYFDSVRTSADDEMLRRIKRFVGADAHKTVHEVLYHAVVRDASLTQDPSNMGLSAVPGGLSEPRKAYSEAVDNWHSTIERRGRTPYVPFPVARRPFPVHERLQVAPGRFTDDLVSVCIASFPPRRKQLKQVVRSLIDQVDLVFVYLNQYDEVPDFLKHPRIIVELGGKDLRDNGKFHFASIIPDGYCVTADDDIIYPKDYVETLIRKIEIYGRKACVGLHGTVFAKPFVSYFEGRRVLHFRQSLDRDRVVDQLGTGTFAFHTSLWRPSSEAWPDTGMVDAWVAVEARKKLIPLISIERKKAWLTAIPMPDDVPPSLFSEFKSSDQKQTQLVASCDGWGVGVAGNARKYIEERTAVNGEAFGSQVTALEMISAEAEAEAAAAKRASAVQRELFKLAVVGRTNKERWKKGGILKSTHLTAAMLKPLGIEVALVDLETDDPRTLGGFSADIVMIYPGDPERPDFKDVLALVDHHALLGRKVLVNLSLNGRSSRKQYICEQMSTWRALYGKRVALMAFGDRVEDDPALAEIADMIVAIPKTLQYDELDPPPFSERDGIFLGDYGKLCDESLLAWPAEDVIEALKLALPDVHMFCVEQYRPKRKRELGVEVLPFLGSEYSRVLSQSRLMVSLVKYATFEMVPMELAAMGVPVLHPKMDNSLSDYLGLGAVEVSTVDSLARCAKALYFDPDVWGGVSDAGRKVAKGLAWENMAAQMYLRLLDFHRWDSPVKTAPH